MMRFQALSLTAFPKGQKMGTYIIAPIILSYFTYDLTINRDTSTWTIRTSACKELYRKRNYNYLHPKAL